MHDERFNFYIIFPIFLLKFNCTVNLKYKQKFDENYAATSYLLLFLHKIRKQFSNKVSTIFLSTES